MVLLSQNVSAVVRKQRDDGTFHYVDRASSTGQVYNEKHMIAICCAVRTTPTPAATPGQALTDLGMTCEKVCSVYSDTALPPPTPQCGSRPEI